MTGFLRVLVMAELILALRLGALGDWWAASAMRRLGKLSATFPGPRDD